VIHADREEVELKNIRTTGRHQRALRDLIVHSLRAARVARACVKRHCITADFESETLLVK
jgi:hypothetical protein